MQHKSKLRKKKIKKWKKKKRDRIIEILEKCCNNFEFEIWIIYKQTVEQMECHVYNFLKASICVMRNHEKHDFFFFWNHYFGYNRVASKRRKVQEMMIKQMEKRKKNIKEIAKKCCSLLEKSCYSVYVIQINESARY